MGGICDSDFVYFSGNGRGPRGAPRDPGKREKKKDPQPQGEAKGFWRKEAERSGFAGTAAMFGNALGNAVPFEKPNSRKAVTK